jgi:hypothetical protein
MMLAVEVPDLLVVVVQVALAHLKALQAVTRVMS